MSSGTILVADDDAAIRTVLNQALSRAGYKVRLTGNAATLWRWVAEGEGDVVVTDVVMPDGNAFDLLPRIKSTRPDLPIIVMSAQNTFMTAIRAAEKGAYEYLPKPFDLNELIAVVGRALAEPRGRASAPRREPEGGDAIPLVGRSPAMQDIYRMLARLMQTDLTVMITGESGTGKELVARALHDFGKRRNGPFVAINMAAIPRDLIEAELFGHEKGAFTGAQARSRRPLRAGRGRHAVPRRDRRHAAGGADAAAARAAAGRVHDGRRPHADPDRRAHHRRHQPRPAPADPPGPVPRGPVLPPERRADPPAAAARAPRRHSGPRPPLPRDGRARGAAGEDDRAGRASSGCSATLARQRARAREPDAPADRALPAGDASPTPIVENEIGPSRRSTRRRPSRRPTTVGGAVERHLARYFGELRQRPAAARPLPPLLREVELPLISAALGATRGNQIKAAELLGLNRNTLRKKIRDLDIHVMRRSV